MLTDTDTGLLLRSLPKYGLEGTLPAYVQSSDPVTLASRYISRTLNFFVGTSDYIAGDPRCQADAQGTSHLQKMYFWITTVLPYLGSAASGKLPSATTIDYIKGIGHDPWNIINSDAGVQRLFLDDYDGDGATAAAPKSNGSYLWKSESQMRAGLFCTDPFSFFSPRCTQVLRLCNQARATCTSTRTARLLHFGHQTRSCSPLRPWRSARHLDPVSTIDTFCWTYQASHSLSPHSHDDAN